MKMMSENEARKLVRDMFNDEMKEQEMLNKFNLVKCPICGTYELEEDMEYHKWDLAQDEDKICPDCKENE